LVRNFFLFCCQNGNHPREEEDLAKSGYRPDMKYKKNPSSSSFKDIFWLKHWKTQIRQKWQGFFGGPFSSSLSFWRLTKPAKFTACSNFQISSSLVFGEISPV